MSSLSNISKGSRPRTDRRAPDPIPAVPNRSHGVWGKMTTNPKGRYTFPKRRLTVGTGHFTALGTTRPSDLRKTIRGTQSLPRPALKHARTEVQSDSESRPIRRTSRCNSVTGNSLKKDG